MTPIIVTIEGTDGSGKETQCNEISKKLKSLGFTVKQLSFPMYNSDSSYFVKQYLNGEYGDLSNTKINEYSGSLLFAMDRFISYITDWSNDIKKYDFIIMDRYVESNLIHQGSKIKSISDIIRFIDWEKDFEYNKLGLPKPDITLFLNMSPDASAILRKNRKNKINNSDNQDIHEADREYQLKAYHTAYTISDACEWKKINCTNKEYVKSVKDIKPINEITEMCINEIFSVPRVKRLLKKRAIEGVTL